MKKQLFLFVLAFIGLSSFAVKADIPRPEYPRPQFQRENWINLNGKWSFTFDFGKSGLDRRFQESKGFDKSIIVPFCPESELSGVKYVDFINAMWYHRVIEIPAAWSGKAVILHFGAVDYYASVYIDGKLVGRHWGGTSSFDFDITPFVKPQTQHQLVVQVEDDQRSGAQGRGKQCGNYYSGGCDYTRTTGIWQTVWMEPVDKSGLKSAYIVPELDQKRFVIYPEFYSLQQGQKLRVSVKDGKSTVATQTIPAGTPSFAILPLKQVKTWSPESPFLYDVTFEVLNAKGAVIDKVTSYAGMRKVHSEGNCFFLNNKPYFLRLVLDQGFYPKGIWTAPSDADLKHDIELSMQAGFNGARLHQKVFEERYHYWADKLGYLTWGESSSWGMGMSNIEAARNFLSEWREIVMRDRNYPSIIAWVPFNESWDRPDNDRAQQHDRFVTDIYNLTHSLDYRPVNDVSGLYHVKTDLWSVHYYEQTADELRGKLEPKDGVIPQFEPKKEVAYSGQPYFVDEYGGIKWIAGEQFANNSWGYGNAPKTLDEFYVRLAQLTDVILGYDHISGYCYTQLTDVEQEQNGIYNYDRTPKFDMKKIKAVFSKVPERFK
ncbi:glycoside hydrolase family 2 protein [Parabacteroides sp. FAFU027]|uniref:glycoside hydrolase family 2 protein n=1 Tax=Parabacteroides sp. FAFU027 TaxID=2922715 RepID=UPI001FAF0AE7|nr:sugar-binding domain-containing protein [Parabacteroides sp. FAFU027]